MTTEIRTAPATRCERCGHLPATTDKFCAECGNFLRDAWLDHRLLLAMAHQQEGRVRESQQELERLIAADPDNVPANHELGTFYFHLGMLERAIECYGKATRLAPRFILAHYDLGVALYHRGNMREAEMSFRRCLDIDPNYNAAHYRLALSLFHQGMLEEALTHFERAMLLTPEYLMAHYHMGVIHERRGELDLAAREFEKSLDDGIDEASSLYHLALIRRQKGDDKGADDLLRRAREFGAARVNR
ncbi:MAG: tetratricopeptide repeat protein [Thermoanaerobaculia bacterium]|jgi:tetratricopeptide (TPR) repeat protein